MTTQHKLYSSIRQHNGRSDGIGTFVSVHETQRRAEDALDVIEQVRGGLRVSATLLIVGDIGYRVWNA